MPQPEPLPSHSVAVPPAPDDVVALSTEMAFACDGDGLVVWADERAVRVVDRLVGQRLDQIVVPGDEAKAGNFLRAASAAGAAAGSEPWELGIVGHDGPTTIRMRGAPHGNGVLVVGAILPGGYGTLVADAGELTNELLVMQRESERNRRELMVTRAEARAVLDAAEAMILIDPGRRVVLVNRAFSELTGVAAEAVLGRDFRDLGPLVARVFADPEAFGRLVAGTAADPARRFSADVRQHWPAARDLLLTTAPVPGPDGQLLGRLYALRDVTAERDAARLREERQHALEAEVARAAQLQADLLPRGAPILAGFDFAARCLPARAVGGDFFDWHEPAPGVLTLTLGDVMGKGLSAALLMATVRAALEAVASHNAPAQAVEALAAATERDLERAEAFVTLFHARADATTRRVEYADAGHGHVFVRRAGGAVEGLPARGLPLGVLPGQHYPAGELTMAPGDALVVYSDGLIDARPDLEETPSSLAARLDGATSALASVERLVAFTESGAPLPDDLTVVVLRCREEPPDNAGR